MPQQTACTVARVKGTEARVGLINVYHAYGREVGLRTFERTIHELGEVAQEFHPDGTVYEVFADAADAVLHQMGPISIAEKHDPIEVSDPPEKVSETPAKPRARPWGVCGECMWRAAKIIALSVGAIDLGSATLHWATGFLG